MMDSCILFSTNVPRAVAGGASSKKLVTCKGRCIGAHPKLRVEKPKSGISRSFEQTAVACRAERVKIPGVKVQAGSLRDFVRHLMKWVFIFHGPLAP